jgi:GTP-binding protein YchF
MLQAGFVGLPNVGKTTLFNAVTAQSSALIANYAFSTSKPNVGVVAVPDERLAPLAKLVKTEVIVPASVEFVDIAGLVRGSSQGEGMGNQFLHAIRETDTMVQVVRCFEDEAVVHVEGSINPRRDIETIQIELALADLSTVERRRERVQKTAKGGDKTAKAELEVLDKLQPALEEFKAARSVSLTDDEQVVARNYFLLTMKPTIYAANVNEATLGAPDENEYVKAVREIAVSEGAECVVICAQLEADLVDLSPSERLENLE